MAFCLLKRASILFGDKTFIEEGNQKISFKELYEFSLNFDELLQNIPHKIILLKASFSLVYIALILAIIRNDKIYLPISIKEPQVFIDKIKDEVQGYYLDIDEIIHDYSSKLKVSDKNNLLEQKLENSNAETNEESVKTAIKNFFKNFTETFPQSSLPEYLDFFKENNLRDFSDLDDSESNLINFTKKFMVRFLSNPINILLSSGSTGHPKKIVHSLSSHIGNALGSQQVFKVNSRDFYLLNMPLNHVGGQSIIFKALIFGFKIVIKNEDETISDLLINNKLSLLSLVPTMAYRLINDKNLPLKETKTLRGILLGGAHIDKNLVDELVKQNPKLKIYVSYGSTEMASQIATGEITSKDFKVEVLPFRELKIDPLTSEILVKGETLAKGYLINQKISKITDNEGYFHTRDLGLITNNGLEIKGRIDNMFISGGENISPETIEKVLLENPNIASCVIVPHKDSEWGQIGVALINLNENSNLNNILPKNSDIFLDEKTVLELKEYLRRFLNPIYIPKKFLVWPQNIDFNFKIKRSVLIEYVDKVLKEE